MPVTPHGYAAPQMAEQTRLPTDTRSPAPSGSRLLERLNAAQRDAVTDPSQYLRILAGAGSGKTRVLTHRIAFQADEGIIDPRSVLAVTFTRKAAVELRQRLGSLGFRDSITSGTFHSIAYAQLRSRWAERNIAPPELLERKLQFVGRLIGSRDNIHTLDVIAELEWAAARAIEPDQLVAEATRLHRAMPLGSYQKMADLLADFRAAKLKRRVVDFDDILRLAARDLRTDPTYAAARRWRQRHLFVDEFQDVNPLQFQLLSEWLGPDSTLCVVGDIHQAIYAWNGADAAYLSHFDRWFPTAQTVRLEENYRSTPQILHVANHMLAMNSPGGLRLVPTRPQGPVPQVFVHPTDADEARTVARMLRDYHQPGHLWSEQAVLVRTHSLAGPITEALTSARIPFRTRGGTNLLTQPEAIAVLRALRDVRELGTFLSDLQRAIDLHTPVDDSIDARTSHLDDFSTEDYDAPAPPVEDYDDIGPDTERDQRGTVAKADAADGRTGDTTGALTRLVPASMATDRVANVSELVRLGRDYLALDPMGSAAGFSAWLSSTLRGDADARGADGVEIVSLHASKGLEWPVVHLIGCEDGLMPIHHAETEEALDEELRLAYVAITRAESQLSFHHCQRRTFGTKTVRRKPSPYLETIHEAIAAMLPTRAAARPDFSSGRAALAGARKARSKSKDNDGPGSLDADGQRLFAALREWRTKAARAANVPAYVVFSDATLVEIARVRPKTTAQLLRISGIGPVKVERFGQAITGLVTGE